MDHLVIQKLNAQGRLEKKEAKKGTGFDKVIYALTMLFASMLFVPLLLHNIDK